jgi:hypothetical protein
MSQSHLERLRDERKQLEAVELKRGREEGEAWAEEADYETLREVAADAALGERYLHDVLRGSPHRHGYHLRDILEDEDGEVLAYGLSVDYYAGFCQGALSVFEKV